MWSRGIGARDVCKKKRKERNGNKADTETTRQIFNTAFNVASVFARWRSDSWSLTETSWDSVWRGIVLENKEEQVSNLKGRKLLVEVSFAVDLRFRLEVSQCYRELETQFCGNKAQDLKWASGICRNRAAELHNQLTEPTLGIHILKKWKTTKESLKNAREKHEIDTELLSLWSWKRKGGFAQQHPRKQPKMTRIHYQNTFRRGRLHVETERLTDMLGLVQKRVLRL